MTIPSGTTLAQAQAAQSGIITAACSAAENSATTYNFYDVNGKAVAMTLTDIENFFNAVEAQVDGALSKQETLLGDIASATTVTAVQAIVWS